MKGPFLAAFVLGIVLAMGAMGCGDEDETPEGVPTIKTLRTPKDGAVMVLIPAGDFLMGTSDGDMDYYKIRFPLRPASRFDNERPQRTVTLDAFYIDQLEVTNKQYRQFLSETGYQAEGYKIFPPYEGDPYPAIVLKWADAVAYATWAGKRLPTEAEWEKAARGTDGRIWPWGSVWDGSKLSGNDGTGLEDGYKEMAPVGKFPHGASPYGALDMAGNVWEWTNDWYDAAYYANAPGQNPQGPESGAFHVLRGGGWAENLDFTRCASRWGSEPGSLLRGFRCAMDDRLD